jgi:hypothetical protein
MRKTTTVVAARTQHGRAACVTYDGVRLAERHDRRGAAHARVAIGETAGMAVRKGGPRRMDQRAKAGLGMRVQRDSSASRCATPASRTTSHKWARPGPFEIRLALFERVFSKFVN